MTNSISPSDIDRMKTLLMGALRAIRDICETHGIRYSLYCGTLLGCIRHGGFIPWDNDIDLTMPLEDYRRFLKIAPKELPEQYAVEDFLTNDDYSRLWARVYVKGTTAMYERNSYLNIHQGICIDIYPMIGACADPAGLKRQTAVMRLAWGIRLVDIRIRHGRSENGKIDRVLRLIPHPVRSASAKILLRMAFRKTAHASRLCSVDSARFIPKYDPADWDSYTEKSFEGELFSIPSAYDRLLTIMYGNYMQLPPEDKRVPHFFDGTGDDFIFDLDRDSSAYAHPPE